MPRQLKDLLKAYELFTSKSDSPQVFHMWVALNTIAGAAQRKIFMHALYYDILTNMYVILTSPPGRAKKGAALRTGKRFLARVRPPVNFATESSSPEGIYDIFTRISNPAHQSLSLFSMELGTLMSTRPAEMVDFLTDIFDGNADFGRHTMKHGGKNVTRPWLALSAGTTPKWLGDKLGLLALQGGLVARCIFPYSEERILNNPFPREDNEFKELGQAIVEDLSHIATLEGEFDFDGGDDGEAFKWFEAWYKDRPQEHDVLDPSKPWRSRFPKVDDPRTATYYDRKDIHLLKVAMALSLSYKDELLLRTEDLKRALVLLNATEPGMHKALGAAGKNPLAGEIQRLASQIALNKRLTYKEIVIANFHEMTKDQIDMALVQLVDMGQVRREGFTWIWAG